MQWCLPELPGNRTRENMNRCEIQYLGNVHHQLGSYQSTVCCSYLGIMVFLKASELVPRLSKQTPLKLWLITEYKGKSCVKDIELCILYKQTHTYPPTRVTKIQNCLQAHLFFEVSFWLLHMNVLISNFVALCIHLEMLIYRARDRKAEASAQCLHLFMVSEIT